MRLLLDTHIFLWFITGDVRLPDVARDAIRDAGNEALLSVASMWEMAIKSSLGKLPLPGPAGSYLPRQRERHGIASLSVDEADVFELAGLPSLHRDPFDRLLICQAIRRGLTIVTADRAILAYPATFLLLT
jgi:PIN domain nuclease of toxin-antitoxin system